MGDLIIGEYFTLSEKMGSGSFGEVYAGKDLRNGSNVAIKLENIDTRFPQLASEAESYRMLEGGEGIPKLHYFAQQGDYLVMVIDLLGPDLYHCHSEEKFTKDQVFDIGAQLMKRMEFIHSRGLIYRDVKPENFLFGLYSKSEMVHVIDFGLAKGPLLINGMQHTDKCRSPQGMPTSKEKESGVPLRPDHNQLIGTARYASIAAHTGLELIWRDDLESIGYMLVFFLAGPLPWQGMKAPKGEVQLMYDNIGAVKQKTTLQDLCKNCPEEIMKYMTYVRTLNYGDRPDYVYLRHLFQPPKKAPTFELSDDVKQQMASMSINSTGSSPRSTVSVTRKISTLPEIFNRLSAAFGFRASGVQSPQMVVTSIPPPGSAAAAKMMATPPPPPERLLAPSQAQQHYETHGTGTHHGSPPPPPPSTSNPSHSHSGAHPAAQASSLGSGSHGPHHTHASSSLHHPSSSPSQPSQPHHTPHSLSSVPSPPLPSGRRSKEAPPRISKAITTPLNHGHSASASVALVTHSSSPPVSQSAVADSSERPQIFSPMQSKPLRPTGAPPPRGGTSKDRYALEKNVSSSSNSNSSATMTQYELTRGREKERQKDVSGSGLGSGHHRAKTPPAMKRAPTPPRSTHTQVASAHANSSNSTRGGSPSRPPPTPAMIADNRQAPSISRATSDKLADRARSISPSHKQRTRSDPTDDEDYEELPEAKRPTGGKIQNMFRFS